MDEWTASQIGFSKIQNALQPHSLYGQLHKQARMPFCAGEEAAWQADHEDVMRLFRGVDESRGQVFSLQWPTELRGLPDVRSIPAILVHGAALQVEQVAALKQFVVQVLAIDEGLAKDEIVFPWWEVMGIADIARHLSSNAALPTRDFSLKDLEDSGYDQALRAFLQARANRMAAEREYLKRLVKDYDVPLRRDQTILMAQEDAEKIERAKRDERLRIRLQTPFDVVFDPQWTDEVRAFMRLEEDHAEKLQQEEVRLLRELSIRLRQYAGPLEKAMDCVGRLDELVARVELATAKGYVFSRLDATVHIHAGRQPDSPDWVPVSVEFHEKVALLTGPNMGGKSATQKTWLLLQACHQMGYPIPAKEYIAPLFKAIRYVGGDAQSMTSGLSSFGAEMVMVTEALGITNGFLCFDEIVRHTNPAEGEALMVALLEELLEKNSGQFVLATHFSLPVKKGIQYLRVAGLREDALQNAEEVLPRESAIARLNAAMDYRIIEMENGEVPRQGLRIAKWLGVPKSLLEKAEQVLHEKESKVGE